MSNSKPLISQSGNYGQQPGAFGQQNYAQQAGVNGGVNSGMNGGLKGGMQLNGQGNNLNSHGGQPYNGGLPSPTTSMNNYNKMTNSVVPASAPMYIPDVRTSDI